MAKRRVFSAEFKAKVALEALAGDLTMSQLSAKYGVHANMIAKWKSQAREGLTEIFSNGKARNEKSQEDQIKELHTKIGRLAVENDFLSKAFGR
jgi:transposase